MTTEALIKRLRKGWLSSAEAFREFGTLKLTSRVSELRRVHKIESKTVQQNGKRFNFYRLAR
jgi:hypothetical protein